MSKHIFIITLSICFSFISQAQKGFRGEVISVEGEPIPRARIVIQNTPFASFTNMEGQFSIEDIPAGTYTIDIWAFGYESLEKIVEIKGMDAPVQHFVLNDQYYQMPQVDIVERRNQLNSNTPGSISSVDEKTIREINPMSGNEVFRQMPGIHVVDEEGMGLRINIGIRGLNPDKSRNTLILEDGVPVALGPYGEPELYYTPAIERMSGIEVLKGSGSILHGPQTVGGVVNYITKDPTKTETFELGLRGGSGGLFSANAFYGNTYGKAGVAFNVLHKRGDNIGMLNFHLTDVSAKIKIQTSQRSVLGLKLSIYNEESNATYVGLTTPMYNMGNMDFVRIAPDDLMAVRRYSVSMTHDFFINERSKLKTTAFAYTTTRNWRRQDFTYNQLNADGEVSNYPSNYSGVFWGDTTIAGGAILMRNSTGNRNRQFEVAGIESRFSHEYDALGTKNFLVAGARFMFERAYEQRINGQVTDLSYGTLQEAEIRTGLGTSVFIHNQTQINDKFSLTAGVRGEGLLYEREIQRVANVDTLIANNTNTMALIPGAGLNYTINKYNTVFAGIHRGFAPPRLKDAISNTGEDLQLDAELSWNYEIGSRGKLFKGIVYEMTFFYMDFSNQIIPVSESSGGNGTGLVNGGKTTHTGLEFHAIVSLHDMIKMNKHRLTLAGNMTFVEAKFSEDRFVGGDLTNVRGNYTPYAPRTLSNASLTYEHQLGFGFRFQSTFVGEQFSNPLNTIDPTNDGRNGKIDAYKVFDATALYHIKKINTTLTLGVKNITNERAIVSRRPQGIRVMNPRLFTISLLWKLG
jgi:Fe(3+) dicitrate transport protein